MEDAFAEHGNKTVIGHIAERLSRETDPRKRDLAEMLWPYAKGNTPSSSTAPRPST